jgi:EAL domain-containing protein (putative c-di-GMP-specific phosphodiesterase class I)
MQLSYFEEFFSRIALGSSSSISMQRDDGVLLVRYPKVEGAIGKTYSAASDAIAGRTSATTRIFGKMADLNVRHQLEHDLREAISRNELELHYQPVVEALTRRAIGAEALLRWRHPQHGYIRPDQFIPLAEETGLIIPIGEWVLQRACSDAAEWPPHIKVAVNLSVVQFQQHNLLDVILCALVESGLPPERLELEITESILIESEPDVLAVVRQLKNVGISLALDDFGTGYSSLSYLTRLPFDKIKIDKSVTQNLTKRAECAAIISSVRALAYGLNIATTAEGVETEQQFEMLRAAGITSLQGYLFGRPCPVSELSFLSIDAVSRRQQVA